MKLLRRRLSVKDTPGKCFLWERGVNLTVHIDTWASLILWLPALWSGWFPQWSGDPQKSKAHPRLFNTSYLSYIGYLSSWDFYVYLSPMKVWGNIKLTESSPEYLTMRRHRRPTPSELAATTALWAHRNDLMNSSQQTHGVSCKVKETYQQAHSGSSSYEFNVS